VAVDRPGESPASGGGAPAGNWTVVREGPGLNHVLHGELPCDPEKVLGRSPDLEKQRRSELDGGGPAAAAGTRVSVKVWLGLINKRLGEVLRGTEGSLGAWVSRDGDWSGVHTGGANGGRRRLGWKRVCARGATGAGLYGRLLWSARPLGGA
jgi:hypothetical protein